MKPIHNAEYAKKPDVLWVTYLNGISDIFEIRAVKLEK